MSLGADKDYIKEYEVENEEDIFVIKWEYCYKSLAVCFLFYILFGEGCFSKSFSVCTEEFAIRNFVSVYDNMKDLNKAIKELKQFLNTNLK